MWWKAFLIVLIAMFANYFRKYTFIIFIFLESLFKFDQKMAFWRRCINFTHILRAFYGFIWGNHLMQWSWLACMQKSNTWLRSTISILISWITIIYSVSKVYPSFQRFRRYKLNFLRRLKCFTTKEIWKYWVCLNLLGYFGKLLFSFGALLLQRRVFE